MKKIIVISFLMVFLLTGCGAGVTETLSCSYDSQYNNISTSTVYSIDYQDKEVKKVRVTYKYQQDNPINDDANDELDTDNDMMDGVGTGTDGTTNDTQVDNDGIIDGVVGSAIDSIINGVTDIILDISGIRDRHMNVQNMYGSLPGFSVQNVDDNSDNNYTVTYIIDYDNMSDDDLATLNLSRDIDTIRSNYIQQGFTCR